MVNALIGFTGFVGSTLLKQTSFEKLFRSNNIHEIKNQTFDMVVCAGAPAQKWIANKEPEADLRNIERLIDHLKSIKCEKFVLISTIDVFRCPIDVTENTCIDGEDSHHPYGLHRRLLETFVEDHFDNSLIVRLPGLVGSGLRKNVIYDFLNNNNLDMIESRGVFQFYPMVNLFPDIKIALDNNLKLVHFTAEPISVADIAQKGFAKEFNHTMSNQPARYSMKTIYAHLFGKQGSYQYNQAEILLAVRAYAQSEQKTIIRVTA